MINNINNGSCPNCLKSNVCTWYQQLSKLNSTEKKDVPLEITVKSCEEFLTAEED